MTPEGKVKARITALLARYQPHLPMRVTMPVPFGYGQSHLDYDVTIAGHVLAIEAKAPGEWLTPRQRKIAREIWEAGGTVFAISNDDGLAALHNWLALQECFYRMSGGAGIRGNT
jgi:hypothetical protein